MRSTVFFHLFVLAVFSTVIACGPAETDPKTGSDVSQQEPNDAGTSISLDSGTSSAPDAGTTSEVDSGTNADPCAPYVDMTRGQYTCSNAFHTVVTVQLVAEDGNCRAFDPNAFSGVVVDTIPSPIPDQHNYVQPQMVNGAAGSAAMIPSFVSGFREQGSEVRNTCSRSP